MRYFRFLLLPALALTVLFSRDGALAKRVPAAFAEKKFSFQAQDSDIRAVLKLIAAQGEVRIEADDSVTGKVSYTFSDITLENALKEIAKDHNLIYHFDNGIIYIEKESATAKEDSSAGPSQIYLVKIKNSSAKQILEKVPKIFKPNESLTLHESTNSFLFYGSKSSYQKLVQFVAALDEMPVQILIDAQIVETSKNFMRDIGFRWGDLRTDLTVGPNGRGTGNINTGVPGSPNLTAKFLLGFIDSNNLEAHLVAAESAGEAKIVSRPKIVTLNNQMATINSGVTFHVKTLSGVSTGGSGTTGGSTGVATGNLQKVTAGLQLQVLPLIVGDGLIKMEINITNSEPNDGLAVDGIPGIVDNSATTSIIVKDGNTAAIAGLIKTTLGKSESRAPFLSSIPLIGWLFKSHSEKDRNTELVILITPKLIVNGDIGSGAAPTQAEVKSVLGKEGAKVE